MGVILNNVVGFSLFGLATRLYQLGIQQRPLNTYPIAHVVYMLAGGGIGYAVVGIEKRQAQLLTEMKEIREKNRHNAAAREEQRIKRLGIPAREEARAKEQEEARAKAQAEAPAPA